MRADARFCASSSCTRRGRCFATTPRSSTCERPCRSVTLALVPSPTSCASICLVQCLCRRERCVRERESMCFIPWQTSHGITTPVHKKQQRAQLYSAALLLFTRCRANADLSALFFSLALFVHFCTAFAASCECIFVSHSWVISVN